MLSGQGVNSDLLKIKHYRKSVSQSLSFLFLRAHAWDFPFQTLQFHFLLKSFWTSNPDPPGSSLPSLTTSLPAASPTCSTQDYCCCCSNRWQTIAQLGWGSWSSTAFPKNPLPRNVEWKCPNPVHYVVPGSQTVSDTLSVEWINTLL